MSAATKRRAIGYVRVSRVFAGEQPVSPEQQREDIADYCERHGIELIDVETDRGKSAGQDKKRPAYDRMRRRIRAGEASMVVCYKLDRLSRSVIDFADLLRELREHDCEFVSVSEQFDTSTAMGEAFVMITMVFAQLERARACERNGATAAHRRRKGAAPAGPTPYGYRRESGRLFVEPEQAEIVELIARSIEAGLSLSALARQLNDDGVQGPTHGRAVGRWVSNDTVRRVVQSPTVAGLLRAHDGSDGYVSGEWEPIIAVERWHALQELLSDTARRTRKSSTPTLLGGLAKCSRCSSSLRPRNQGKYRYLRCENGCVSISRDDVEQLVQSTLLARFSGVEIPAIDESQSSGADVEHLRALADVLFEQASDGTLDAATYARRSAALERRIAEAEQRDTTPPDPVVVQLAGSTNLAAEWPQLDPLERRAILAHVFDSVVIHPAIRRDGSDVAERVEIDGVRLSMTID